MMRDLSCLMLKNILDVGNYFWCRMVENMLGMEMVDEENLSNGN